MSNEDPPVPEELADAEVPGSLEDYPHGSFPADVLRAASEQELKSLLDHETKELNALRARASSPVDLQGRQQELEIRTVELLNALQKVQSDDFWRAVMVGCPWGSNVPE